jgi:hypothetical protein
VPGYRKEGMKRYPGSVQSTVDRVQKRLRELATQPGADRELLERRILEVADVSKKYQVTPPPEVMDQIRSPWPSDVVMDLVGGMHWHVWRATGEQKFITSDNPAFFFGGYGLGSDESELSFPLSSDLALHGSRVRVGQAFTVLPVPTGHVKELNRRLASTTTRFAFYHKSSPWLVTLLQKERPFLSRIVLQPDRRGV